MTLLLLDDGCRIHRRRLLFRRCRDNVLVRPSLGILIRYKSPRLLFRSTTRSSLSTPRLWSIPWCQVSKATPYSAVDCRVPSHILLPFVQLLQYGFVSSHLILLFRHVRQPVFVRLLGCLSSLPPGPEEDAAARAFIAGGPRGSVPVSGAAQCPHDVTTTCLLEFQARR